ncbi:MAG: permease prefix domain 1-containing protein [Eubacteriales bacterium]|nr:permease prefix domain 1-containing protein [Eubacteriales bacterium]
MNNLFDEYLDHMLENMRGSRKEKRDIRNELELHMQELYDTYISAGYEEKKAGQNVIIDMGDSSALAREFNPILKRKKMKRYMRAVSSLNIIMLAVFCTIIFYSWKEEKEKYLEFAEGLDSGKVIMSEELKDSFYNLNYKDNELIENAINCYYKEKETDETVQMVINNEANVFITMREVYGSKSEGE